MFCQKCGKEIPEGTGKVVNDHLLCPDCAKKAVKCYCQRCGKELPNTTKPQENGKILCKACAKLPDDSADDKAYWDPGKKHKKAEKFGMLPVWIAAVALVIVVGAVASMFATKKLCFHSWVPATCEQAEYCSKCGKIHGDPIPHKWREATCTEPRTCMVCGLTEGEALGHTWIAATCTDPETCSLCGETQGNPAGHKWEAATCEHPKRCTVCGLEQGEPGEHDWADATCTEPRTCKLCGATDGEALGHTWIDATCTEPRTCSVCGETEGDPAGHKWKDATVLAPKTCTVCGETQGDALDIHTMLPIDLIGVEKSDFIGATGDARHEAIGCEQCSASGSTLVSDLFPGCVLAYGDSADSTPNHIHVFSGKVTDSTKIGMTYTQLVKALGAPVWSLNEADSTASALYTISGHQVEFIFTDKKVFDDIIAAQMGQSSDVNISRPTMKVAAARIS